MTDTAVFSLISRQSTATRYVWCRHCSHQEEITIAVTMPLERVECAACKIAGFLVGHAKLR